MKRRTAALATLTLALAACRVVLGIDDRELRSDAGTDVQRDSDPGEDAMPTEASVVVDAGDGGCGHLVCEDFDDDAGLSRWNVVRAPGQGKTYVPTLEIVGDASTTAPGSLFFKATPIDFGSIARIDRALTLGGANGVQCAMDVRIDAISAGWIELAAIVASGGTPQREVGVRVYSTGILELLVGDGSTTLQSKSGFPIGFGSWRRLTLALSVNPPEVSVSDGISTTRLPFDAWPTTPTVGLLLGMTFGFPSGPSAARGHLDHVVCDIL